MESQIELLESLKKKLKSISISIPEEEESFANTLKSQRLTVDQIKQLNGEDLHHKSLFLFKDEDENTLNLVALAAVLGLARCLRELHIAGASINCVLGSERNTALHYAVRYSRLNCVKVLLEVGASVNVKNNNGFTPLFTACQYEIAQKEEISQLLLDAGAELNCVTRKGETPLVACARQNKIDMLTLLIKRGAISNGIKSYCIAALCAACEHGHVQCVDMLLKAGAYPNKSMSFGMATPMYAAICSNQVACLRLLLEYGVDKDKTDTNGSTPLLTACKLGNTEIVRLLLEFNADENITNYDGSSPLFKASLFGFVDIVKLLLENNIQRGLPDKVQELKKSLYISNKVGNTGGYDVIQSRLRLIHDLKLLPSEESSTDIEWSWLPLELLHKVFSFVQDPRIMTVVLPAVSESWRAVAVSMSTLDLSFIAHPATPSVLSTLLSREGERGPFRWLHHLTLSTYAEKTTLVLTTEMTDFMISQCPNLTSLEMRSCELEHDHLLSRLVHGLPRLKALTLSHHSKNRTSQCAESAILSAFDRPCQIKHLNLRYLRNVRYRSLAAISANCPKLYSLELAHCDELDDQALALLGQQSPFLRRIALDDCRWVTDLTVKSLGKAWPLLEHVSLWLSHCVTDKGVDALAKACPHLRRLELSGCYYNLTDKCCEALAKKAKKLEYLALIKARHITKAGVKYLLDANPSLEIIY